MNVATYVSVLLLSCWMLDGCQCELSDSLLDSTESAGGESGASQVPVRLVGSEHGRQGRVEVFYNSTWGTVCDNSFTDISAKVVCSQLGFGYLGYVLRTVHEPGTGPIWLDKVQCTGHETELAQCPHLPWGYSRCNHRQDVSIACYVHTAHTPADGRGSNMWLPRRFQRL